MESNSPVAGMFEALGRVVSRGPLWVLGVLLAVTGILGFHAAKVRVNNSNDIFFVEDDPLLVAHRRFEQRFGSDQFVMVYVEGDLFRPEAFAAIDQLVDAMHELRWQDEPAFTGILSPYHAPTMRDGGGSITVETLLPDLDHPSAAALEAAKKDATEHPVYRDLIVSRAGDAGAIIGTLRALSSDEAYGTFIAHEMRRLVDTPVLNELGVLLVGDPIFKMQVDDATVRESSVFGVGAIAVSVLALWLMFRRKRQVFAAIGVVVLAVVWTVGLMSLFDVEFTLVSIILPLVIVIMGLGSGVHIINEFRELRRAGHHRRDAVVRTLRATGLPCFLTAATTAVGFLAMVSAPVAPLRTLGAFASVGVLLSFLLAVTLVPAVLSIGSDGPDRQQGGDDGKNSPMSARLFSLLADVVVERHVAVTVVFLALSIGLGTGLRHIRVESHVLQAFREDQEFRRAVEHVDARLGGSTGVEVIVDTGVARGVYDPDFLRRLEAFQAWVERTQGDVVGTTLSLADLMKEINFAFTGLRELPDSRDRAAQLMLLYETGDADARLVTDHAARRARISLRTRQTTTRRSLALEAALRQEASRLFDTWQPAPTPESAPRAAPASTPRPGELGGAGGDDDTVIVLADEDSEEVVIIDDTEASDAGVVQGAVPASAALAQASRDAPAPGAALVEDPPLAPGASRVEIAGTSQLFVHLADYVIDSQIQSFALAALIIAVLMVLMLRSLALGLAVMVPNLLPIVCIYGVMGWTGISVDWLTALIAVAALGVAVDGTIHIGTRYRLGRLAGLSAAEAARHVMTSIGRALIVTSVVLSAGFCVVAPSILASLARFGLLMAVCLFLALLFDLLMTPAVLAWLSPGATERARE